MHHFHTSQPIWADTGPKLSYPSPPPALFILLKASHDDPLSGTPHYPSTPLKLLLDLYLLGPHPLDLDLLNLQYDRSPSLVGQVPSDQQIPSHLSIQSESVHSTRHNLLSGSTASA